MPIFKAGPKLIYYAHVPKCGGSSVEAYLHERFGDIAFVDSRHTFQSEAERWSRTSPQHINTGALERLFPAGFFDAVFTIVRHPVARVISAYHFQRDTEKIISPDMTFSDWLETLPGLLAEDPFRYDNHLRPMSDIVPGDARVFYLEHGIDALVPWFDLLTGEKTGPRAFARVNTRKSGGATVTPSAEDLDRIARLFAIDFDRFEYRVDQKAPLVDAPDLSPEFIAERDAALKEANSTSAKLKALGGKIARRLGG